MRNISRFCRIVERVCRKLIYTYNIVQYFAIVLIVLARSFTVKYRSVCFKTKHLTASFFKDAVRFFFQLCLIAITFQTEILFFLSFYTFAVSHF